MIDALLSLERLVAIAHRGGSKLRPENTLVAFDHAVSLGVDAIECDVHLSRDDQVVVIHDATLERTTDVTGPVSALTAAELARADAGRHFLPSDGFPFRARGVGVPKLNDVLDRYRALPVIVEIKGEDTRLAERTIAIIEAHDAVGRVLVGGFSHAMLEAVRRRRPDLVTSASSLEVRRALRRSYFRLPPARGAFAVFQMPFRLRGRRLLQRPFVRAARRARVPVHAWIVDEPGEMRQIIDWGVTGIISDRPDLAVEIVRAYPERASCATV